MTRQFEYNGVSSEYKGYILLSNEFVAMTTVSLDLVSGMKVCTRETGAGRKYTALAAILFLLARRTVA